MREEPTKRELEPYTIETSRRLLVEDRKAYSISHRRYLEWLNKERKNDRVSMKRQLAREYNFKIKTSPKLKDNIKKSKKNYQNKRRKFGLSDKKPLPISSKILQHLYKKWTAKKIGRLFRIDEHLVSKLLIFYNIKKVYKFEGVCRRIAKPYIICKWFDKQKNITITEVSTVFKDNFELIKTTLIDNNIMISRTRTNNYGFQSKYCRYCIEVGGDYVNSIAELLKLENKLEVKNEIRN